LREWHERKLRRPASRIAVHPDSGGPAIVRRVLAEPIVDPGEDDEAEHRHYERDRKARWRAARSDEQRARGPHKLAACCFSATYRFL
jgi:hypothetical protein